MPFNNYRNKMDHNSYMFICHDTKCNKYNIPSEIEQSLLYYLSINVDETLTVDQLKRFLHIDELEVQSVFSNLLKDELVKSYNKDGKTVYSLTPEGEEVLITLFKDDLMYS